MGLVTMKALLPTVKILMGGMVPAECHVLRLGRSATGTNGPKYHWHTPLENFSPCVSVQDYSRSFKVKAENEKKRFNLI